MTEASEKDETGAAALRGNAPKFPPVIQRLESGMKLPICLLVVGMAGSGKTTLLSQLQRHVEDKFFEEKANQKDQMHKNGEIFEGEEDDAMPAYCVNLDPATLGEAPFDVSIDIRDTVNYKQVMEQHQLGPNGAIMTSLNLFATKFDQVLGILERRAVPSERLTEEVNDDGEREQNNQDVMEYILVDTPGQIEAFTWSASGQIISEALASAFPTVLCFVVDTVRCASSPNTFMSNMLYACSMLYRTRLPLVVCFNKTDVVSHDFCMDWMRDYESFQQALDDHASSSGFYGSLTRSLSLVLDEFYSNFANAVGVSAVTGDGLDEFWTVVKKAASQDFQDYLGEIKLRVEEQEAKQRAIARSQVRRLQRDMGESE